MHGLPLKDVLAAVRLTRIDLLSLDVEGSPPDLPLLIFWIFWNFSKSYFDVFGRF